MRLQDLLLAQKIELRENEPEARRFLETVKLADLQRKETWPRLRGIAKIRPRGDILPIRTKFSGGPNLNIGLVEVVGAPDTYYTFADVIASKLLTGKCPEILETIELVPDGLIKTKVWRLFGDPDYCIDLSTEDLFTRLIDLRDEVERKRDIARAAHDPKADYYDKLQDAIKLLANSTSYGTLVEYITDERLEERRCIIYTGTGDPLVHKAQVVERPVEYFAGPVGTLIPAAGRLMLAIAEALGLERGIPYAFCDTDSMCFARPEAMSWYMFAERVQEIVDWFAPLSPYRQPGSIFQIEQSANKRLRCVAIAAKRYDLYHPANPAKGESITFAKISSHGMGSFHDPAGYQSIYPDAPVVKKPRGSMSKGKALVDIVKSEGAVRIIYDMWREAMEAIESGKPIPTEREYLNRYDYFSHTRIGNAHEFKLYEALPGARPCTFFSIVPHMLLRSFQVDGALPIERQKGSSKHRFSDPARSRFRR